MDDVQNCDRFYINISSSQTNKSQRKKKPMAISTQAKIDRATATAGETNADFSGRKCCLVNPADS
jgi:hypothetical protein